MLNENEAKPLTNQTLIEDGAAKMLSDRLPSLTASAFALTAPTDEMSAVEFPFGSSVHSVHDLDHSELVERTEIVRHISHITLDACRSHRHRKHKRIYRKKAAVNRRGHS